MRQSLLEPVEIKQYGKTKPAADGARRLKLVVAIVAVVASGALLYNHFAGPTLVPGQSVPMEVSGTPAEAATTPPAGAPSTPSNAAAPGQPTASPAASTSNTPPAPAHLPRPAGPTMTPNG